MYAKLQPDVPLLLWRATAVGLLLLVLGGLGLGLLLAGGLADPPRAPLLSRELPGPDGLAVTAEESWQRLTVADDLVPPFTLEAEAIFRDVASGAWGVWLNTPRSEQTTRVRLLVRPDGYLRDPFRNADRWSQFIHLRPARNRVALHVAEGEIVLRVNDEIAQRAPYDAAAPASVGILLEDDTNLLWQGIWLYTGR